MIGFDPVRSETAEAVLVPSISLSNSSALTHQYMLRLNIHTIRLFGLKKIHASGWLCSRTV
jgi:hypothetical protein